MLALDLAQCSVKVGPVISDNNGYHRRRIFRQVDGSGTVVVVPATMSSSQETYKPHKICRPCQTRLVPWGARAPINSYYSPIFSGFHPHDVLKPARNETSRGKSRGKIQPLLSQQQLTLSTTRCAIIESKSKPVIGTVKVCKVKDKNCKVEQKVKVKTSKVLQLTSSGALVSSDIDTELSLHKYFDKQRGENKLEKLSKSIDFAVSSAVKLAAKSANASGGSFVDHYTGPALIEHAKLFCPAAKRCLNEPNSGGKSNVSEAVSMQYFAERFAAVKFILEMEITNYWMNTAIPDFLCSVYGNRVGVSVTRAMKYPKPELFNAEDAYVLLKKKMNGLIMARSGVCEEQAFFISFLHIWCQTPEIARHLQAVYPAVIAEDKTNTVSQIIVLCSVYGRAGIYSNTL